MMWVDDTITIFATGEERPTYGAPVDHRAHFHGLLRVSVPDKKIEDRSTRDPVSL